MSINDDIPATSTSSTSRERGQSGELSRYAISIASEVFRQEIRGDLEVDFDRDRGVTWMRPHAMERSRTPVAVGVTDERDVLLVHDYREVDGVRDNGPLSNDERWDAAGSVLHLQRARWEVDTAVIRESNRPVTDNSARADSSQVSNGWGPAERAALSLWMETQAKLSQQDVTVRSYEMQDHHLPRMTRVVDVHGAGLNFRVTTTSPGMVRLENIAEAYESPAQRLDEELGREGVLPDRTSQLQSMGKPRFGFDGAYREPLDQAVRELDRREERIEWSWGELGHRRVYVVATHLDTGRMVNFEAGKSGVAVWGDTSREDYQQVGAGEVSSILGVSQERGRNMVERLGQALPVAYEMRQGVTRNPIGYLALAAAGGKFEVPERNEVVEELGTATARRQHSATAPPTVGATRAVTGSDPELPRVGHHKSPVDRVSRTPGIEM